METCMKVFITLLLAGMLMSPARADESAGPSDASLRELLTVTESESLIESTMAQVDASMQSGFDSAFAGRPLSAAEQAIIDDMRTRTVQIFREEMAWELMEPIFMELYRTTFTQQEIDGMLDFYRSPAGKALITKMPVVMQRSMEAMRARLDAMMPRIQELQRETAARMKEVAPK